MFVMVLLVLGVSVTVFSVRSSRYMRHKYNISNDPKKITKSQITNHKSQNHKSQNHNHKFCDCDLWFCDFVIVICDLWFCDLAKSRSQNHKSQITKSRRQYFEYVAEILKIFLQIFVFFYLWKSSVCCCDGWWASTVNRQPNASIDTNQRDLTTSSSSKKSTIDLNRQQEHDVINTC